MPETTLGFIIQRCRVFFQPSNTVTLFSQPAGVLHLMEIGDVQKKDIVDHPENYTLLTTLDEGWSHDALRCPTGLGLFPRQQMCDDGSLCFRDVEEI